MSETESFNSSWRVPLLLTTGIVVVVIVALLLAKVDGTQRRSLLPSRSLPVVDAEATVAARILPRVYLPDDTDVTPALSTTVARETTAATDQSSGTLNASATPMCTIVQADWTPYIVQPKDSLASLAYRFGIGQNDILQNNCLAQDKLIVGDQILLPRLPQTDASGEQCYAPPPPDWVPYWIRPGDDLRELAKRSKTTVDEVIRVNCLGSAHAAARRVIFLPPPSNPNSLPLRVTPNATTLPRS